MPNPQPRLTDLRAATYALHQALHVHPLLLPLSSDRVTRDDYHWALRAFYAAYAISETQPRTGFPINAPALGWLTQDMQQHRVPMERLDLPYSIGSTESRHLGYLYVKQGSTLGGRVISRHLERALGVKESIGNRFFAGYGAETGNNWKRFTALLETAPNINSYEMTAQAVDMFQLITQCCDIFWQKRQAYAG